MTARVATYEFSTHDMYGLINGLVEGGVRGEYNDYVAAEQTLMAISSILVALEEAEAFDEQRGDTLFGALDVVFKSLSDEDRFDASGFRSALETFMRVMSSS